MLWFARFMVIRPFEKE